MAFKEGYYGYRVGVPEVVEGIFSHFYFGGNASQEIIYQTLLPSFQTIMVFSFGSPASFLTEAGESLPVEKCVVAGPIRQALRYQLPPGARIIVVNFKDDAFFRFFGTAVITQHTVADPDALLESNCFADLWQELCTISTDAGIIDRLVAFCQPYLRERSGIAGQLATFDNPELGAIKTIAGQNNLSERAIQLQHKKHFGYSAKAISRYLRFLKAVELLQSMAAKGNSKTDWFKIIDQCGYYDQSQLIHDFNHFLHISPAQYLKFQQTVCNPRG
ncbi:helix-turn-helix domain-containing protein [Flavihumibacter petaseus]|uniref:Putative AraC family transcriptional regulator n=1 Tax=Flavihumibacter petaseus NBRC 106054 TaxID=1220578 RepID=A0A0E9N6Z4_9BACT|nr:helix-turn-helix domain-containing protein [Flavihumibacter petaseus]GAO45466.1 putative AraC family transcriptional regulator [Flavihumibacter petaseus NBRC 106054]